MNGDERISKNSQELIEASRENGSVFMSAISVWEVSMLEQKKRIIFHKPCINWIKNAMKYGI